MTSDSKDLKDLVTRALANQEQNTVTILSSLLAVQDDVGYVPNEAIDAVAELTGSTINDVWGVGVLLHQPPVRSARRHHSGVVLGTVLPRARRHASYQRSV